MPHFSVNDFFRVVFAPIAVLLTSCVGTTTLPDAARAGDTVALYAGWKHHFDRDRITTTITGADGSRTIYPPGDPHIRAVVDTYPDPLSYLVVGTRAGLSQGYRSGGTYGSLLNSTSTAGDPDWWETTIYLDTPPSLPTGVAQVEVTATDGEHYGPLALTIRPGVGRPAAFSTQGNGPLNSEMLAALERTPHATVVFSGDGTVPAALEVWLSHDPDQSAGGSAGKAFALNPRGEMKNLAWSDDGTHMHVVLLPAGDGTWKDPHFPDAYGMKYWKFYVTGGVTNVAVSKVAAYDKDGNTIPGITALIHE